MYSFLNDKELYGTMASEQASVPNGTPRMQPQQAGPVAVQTQQVPRERPPEARPPPPALPDIFFKSLAVLEQRLMSLEERVVTALEKLSSETGQRPPRTESVGLNFWTFLLAVALSTAFVLFLFNFLRPKTAPPFPQAPMPFMIQSLPPQAPLPQLSSPPTPVIFAAPASFLPRS